MLQHRFIGSIKISELSAIMSVFAEDLAKTSAADMIRCLADGVDIDRIDRFLDLLFVLAAKTGSVTCAVVGQDAVRIQCHDATSGEFEMPRAMSKIRMVCARLALRCTEWCNRQINAYGDQA